MLRRIGKRRPCRNRVLKRHPLTHLAAEPRPAKLHELDSSSAGVRLDRDARREPIIRHDHRPVLRVLDRRRYAQVWALERVLEFRILPHGTTVARCSGGRLATQPGEWTPQSTPSIPAGDSRRS